MLPIFLHQNRRGLRRARPYHCQLFKHMPGMVGALRRSCKTSAGGSDLKFTHDSVANKFKDGRIEVFKEEVLRAGKSLTYEIGIYVGDAS